MFEKEQNELFKEYDPDLDMSTYKGEILKKYLEIDTMPAPRMIKRIAKRKMIKYYKKNKDILQDIMDLPFEQFESLFKE